MFRMLQAQQRRRRQQQRKRIQVAKVFKVVQIYGLTPANPTTGTTNYSVDLTYHLTVQ